MYKTVTRCSATTGEALEIISGPAKQVDVQTLNVGELFVEFRIDPATQYLDIGNMAIADRPTLESPSALTITTEESSVVNNLPAGTDVKVDGSLVGTVNDGTFSFSCPIPGTYLIELEPPFPYIPIIYRVVVNEP